MLEQIITILFNKYQFGVKTTTFLNFWTKSSLFLLLRDNNMGKRFQSIFRQFVNLIKHYTVQ